MSENQLDQPEKPSVIKKLGNGLSLGLPVGKLVNSPSELHSPVQARVEKIRENIKILLSRFSRNF